MDADRLTFVYKAVGDKPILLDLYLPDPNLFASASDLRPTIIYFHGGGLTVGTRQSWFPSWLQKRLSRHGCIFISADYRLIPPSHGHDIIDDIRDVFTFVRNTLNSLLDHEVARVDTDGTRGSARRCRIDPDAIGVAGTSAGGLCAYLAAMHVLPKPRVMLSMYGMGGDFFTSHYLTPKSEPFSRGRELLDPGDFSPFLHPGSSASNPLSTSPLAYHPPSYHIPGYPSNPRMLLGRLYLQLGTFLDYYTGQHDPSLSTILRQSMPSDNGLGDKQACIPDEHQDLFPQLGVTCNWPPTCIVHGTSDTAVLVHESRNMVRLLHGNGVSAELLEVEGKEHSFDYESGAEDLHEVLFDYAVDFLLKHLGHLDPSDNKIPTAPASPTTLLRCDGFDSSHHD
ncbi:alpha/beta-hydrolase [Gyrodon lividus]|nr:alpha/beta-hydrolase [Gyrodon lividus]